MMGDLFSRKPFLRIFHIWWLAQTREHISAKGVHSLIDCLCGTYGFKQTKRQLITELILGVSISRKRTLLAEQQSIDN